MSTLTTGDGAESPFRTAVATIPQGYAIALLGDDSNDDLVIHGAITPGFDVYFLAANSLGVHYQDLDPYSGAPVGPRQLRSWESIARVHVY